MRPKSDKSPYKEKICEKCGASLWETPTLEALTAKKRYAICKKCGNKSPTKPGDILNLKETNET